MFNSVIHESEQFTRAIENVNDANSAILSVICGVGLDIHQQTQTKKRWFENVFAR